MPSFCGVILAAGESTRMGRDKALLPWPPQNAIPETTFLSAAIRSLIPFNDLILVVAGKNAANISPVIDVNGAFLVINPQPEQGQFSSLQCGLQEVLNRGRDAAMVTLVDRPPVLASTLEMLLSEFHMAAAEGKWAVVPEYEGKHGHPILIGRDMIEAFYKSPSTATARDIQHQHQAQIKYVPVADPFVAANVDTPDDYARLMSHSAQNSS